MIDFKKITKIYYGLDNHCRCGCGGYYADRGEKYFDVLIKKAKKLIYDDSKLVTIGDNNINISLDNNKAITLYND